jgi:hypothetical protein
VNIDIGAFKAEYARRSAMTVFERINEDAAKAKAAHRRQLAALARKQPERKQYNFYLMRMASFPDRARQFWWMLEPERWSQHDANTGHITIAAAVTFDDWNVTLKTTTSRPTEIAAIQAVYVQAVHKQGKNFDAWRLRVIEKLIAESTDPTLDWEASMPQKLYAQLALAI